MSIAGGVLAQDEGSGTETRGGRGLGPVQAIFERIKGGRDEFEQTVGRSSRQDTLIAFQRGIEGRD